MARKSVKAEIHTVQGTTVKVDKLADRTFRTVKVGDYIPASIKVRGKACFLYGQVLSRKGANAVIGFGSHGMTKVVVIPQMVNVYRPN